MANNIVLIDFFGLPGCGKSVISHELSELLRNEGLRLGEPTFDMDHHTLKWVRFLKKSFFTYLYQCLYRNKASRLLSILNDCQQNKSFSFNKQKRNLFYKLYLINTSQAQVILMDEGLAQAAISMTVGTNHLASFLLDEFKKALPEDSLYIPILIKSDIEKALSNIQLRETNDSRVEKMKDSNMQRAFMELFLNKVDEISAKTSYSIDATCCEDIHEIAVLLRKKLTHIC